MADDELEEDSPEPEPAPRPDPNAGVRRLAWAILLRAILDYKQRDKYQRQDAERFLRPSNAHLMRLAECAGLNPERLREGMKRVATLPLSEVRTCFKCKALVPVAAFGVDYCGRRERYCPDCRAATPIRADLRRPRPVSG
jgi:hypothetical protein